MKSKTMGHLIQKCGCYLIVLLLIKCVLVNTEDTFKDYIASKGISRIIRSYVVRSKDHVSANSLLKSSNNQGAMFLTPNSSMAVAQMGGTAKLPCIVRKFNNGVVSWIRKKDSPPTILTVGLGTYIADDRFLVEHARHLQNWGLVIKHVQMSDAGTYECQVSTHPTSSIFIELKVTGFVFKNRACLVRAGRSGYGVVMSSNNYETAVTFYRTPRGYPLELDSSYATINEVLHCRLLLVTEAVAEISGAPDLHIRAGSRLRIVCRLRHSTEPPSYVFWYHDHRMINHDPGVRVTADRATSVLRVDDVDPSFSGNYTCYPSNATPAYVNVHVLNATEEENPAAMMHNSSCDYDISKNFFLSIVLVVIALVPLKR